MTTTAPSLATRLRAIAQSTPAAIAVEDGSARLTYAMLDAAADRFAKRLMAAGAVSQTLVGLWLPRSAARIVAQLGIWRAGGAALLLDPHWPEQRVRTLLAGCDAPLLITDRPLIDVACLGPEHDGVAAGGPLPGASPPEHLAYVIATSGSTGTPKAVEISHGNLQHLIAWHLERFGVGADDRTSHIAGLGFDASVWEVWPALFAGGTVVLADEPVRTSPDALMHWLVSQRITTAFVPTVLAERMIVADWPASAALRILLTGGELLRRRPRAGLGFVVVNNYGPAECTVVATSGIVAGGEGPPDIGQPIIGTSVRILDDAGRPVADGEPGEITIGGAGVGPGYRGRPDLTLERFRPDPWATAAGGTLYLTGDLGRRLPDGRIMFLGRTDAQIKIRGTRVEPGEVASVLARHSDVAWSAVLGGAEADTPHLVAYVLPARAEPPTAEALQAFLRLILPEAAVPSVFMWIDAVPLSSNGKLDRAALMRDGSARRLPTGGFRAPSTPVEIRVAAIVGGLLGRGHIGADDNFFLLGGQSLLGAQMVLRVRDAFGVNLSLRDLFEAQTVARISVRISESLVERVAAMTEEDAALRMAG